MKITKAKLKAIGAGAAIATISATGVLLVGKDQQPTPAQTIDQHLSTKSIVQELLPTSTPQKVIKGCNVVSELESKEDAYSVMVKNKGTATCKQVVVSLYYADGEEVDFFSVKPTAGNYYWELGDMKSGTGRGFMVRMKNISGNTSMCANARNFGDACTDSIAIGTTSNPTSTPQQTNNTPMVGEFGWWEWDSPLRMTNAQMDESLREAKANGMRSVYVTIDDVLKSDKNEFTSALATYVSKANALGLAVDAEAGWRDWAKPENRWKGRAIIDFLIEYNKTNPKIRAFQSDVEPYLLPEYEENKASVLADFLWFVDDSETRLRGSGIAFSVVIPHFYDSSNKWTPLVSFNGTRRYTFDHVLSMLDRSDNNTIVIMAYRDTFFGVDGVEGIAKQEVSQGGKTRVIIAQEAGNVEPAYVTFYGQSRDSFNAQLSTITEQFSRYAGFGGLALHYRQPVTNLR